jgi:hypothetical protein
LTASGSAPVDFGRIERVLGGSGVRGQAQLEIRHACAGSISALPTLSATRRTIEKSPARHGKAAVHAGVAPTATGTVTPEHAGTVQVCVAGFQQRLSLARLMRSITEATPESSSPAPPQMSAVPVVPQPVRQAAPDE